MDEYTFSFEKTDGMQEVTVRSDKAESIFGKAGSIYLLKRTTDLDEAIQMARYLQDRLKTPVNLGF